MQKYSSAGIIFFIAFYLAIIGSVSYVIYDSYKTEIYIEAELARNDSVFHATMGLFDSSISKNKKINNEIDINIICIKYWVQSHQACDSGNALWAYGYKTKAKIKWARAKMLWDKFDSLRKI